MMNKPYQLALYVFRRDLRLQDNTALIEALSSSLKVLPCFIFDKRQIEQNAYKSHHAIAFMANSLQELDTLLRKKNSRLYFFYGIAEEVIANLIKTVAIEAVFLNRDYTPFSRTRDAQIEKICRDAQIDFRCFTDALLHEPEEVLTQQQTPYTIFTYELKKARELPIAAPRKNTGTNYYNEAVSFEDKNTLVSLLKKYHYPHLAIKGGRQAALTLLKQACTLKNYGEKRDFPAESGTSKLSAHHKFGTLSIRETYAAISQALGQQHTLLTELYWRDFFTHIAFHFPYVFGQSFQKKYRHIEWENNLKKFQAWCEGRTGFPIVDAGMRELNTTGFMHNRVRMIVASFLTKDLHIDWQWGEKYFAQMLIDYDPAVNNGNWQWAASTGCDAQPYFRIFNPWLQQKKFDPECLYIKRYIPELANLSTQIIHTLYEHPAGLFTNYPQTIVNHAVESKKAKAMFAQK